MTNWDFIVETKKTSMPLVKQVHGIHIVEYDRVNRAETTPEADGIVTRAKGLPIYIFTADCMPVLMSDSETGAALHAGWRGVQGGIISKALKLFYPQRLDSVQIVIGPHIRSCCFEVKEDLIAAFESAGKRILPYMHTRKARRFVSLLDYVIEEELKGVAKKNIQVGQSECTMCSEKWPSFRRNRTTDPHIKAILSI